MDACSSAATRARPGPELEDAVARGIVSAGGTAVLGGVLPTPAVALLADHLGVVVSASHNPPEYNGVKLFLDGGKLVDEQEEEIEALFDASGPGGGSVERADDAASATSPTSSTPSGPISPAFGSGSTARTAHSSTSPRPCSSGCGAEVHAIGVEPDGSNINDRCRRDRPRRPATARHAEGLDLGVAFDGDGDRMLAVDERGEPVDGDQIIAVLALHLGVEVVAVTVMSNLGFHGLMAEHGVKVVTTPVGDRYVLEALAREGGLLGGEQSGHVIWLDGHVTGDGLAAGLLLCGAIRGRGTLSEAAAVMSRYPQVLRSVRVRTRELPQEVAAEVESRERRARRARSRPRAAVGHRADVSRPRRGGKCGRCREALC